MSSRSFLVLDTHVWIWLENESSELDRSLVNKIDDVVETGAVVVPAISMWEVAMIAGAGQIDLGRNALAWIREALMAPGIQLAELTPEIAFESCNLPGKFHGDPADRLIVATARVLAATLITRDAKILQYGKQGHVNVLQA